MERARTIYLGENNQYETLVSEEDYDYLIKWKWNYKVSSSRYGKRVYARRGGGKGRQTILMHNEVLERKTGMKPGPGFTGDHKDRNSLNNQRENLDWASRRRQNQNQTNSGRFKKKERLPGFI